MGMTTAFTDDPDNTDILIDRLSVNNINNGTVIGGMRFTVTGRMTARTFLSFRLKRSHEIKKQRFR